ncbi:biotin-dependent carboxyltransferase family protein [Phaeobacter sp. B1627]|uniref:5-oxoprolinase subunit C family protein n=1 Tax=Phaeobacter sp. B1627 TaxID=2583809 RepID=UPI00111B361E|nr:biotin-dependent carboxyltransferase family protein [Phaeobacter sp. B1627]TNJ43281.1 biotin-dependent carboxyltransferase family protein [Phaeobacter sp. B1627]
MIEVLSLPPLATVQDLGRPGHWAQGLGRAGAMDPLAHRIANWLLGNHETAATLEIPLTPARFSFAEDTVFAIAGAACGATLDGVPLARNWAGAAKEGQVLALGPMTEGARVYLALAGGIDVPEMLGSRSTQSREAFGGFDGRVLRPGDQLRACDGQTTSAKPLSCAMPALRGSDADAITLRVIPSAETDQFSAASLDAFWSQPYSVTPQSNRQGCRLDGPALQRETEGELRSHGIAPGIIQVPGGGQPIIQLADAATMGGYPKIACVIEDDLWRIGQARPGDRFRFTAIDLSQAREIERNTQAELDRIRTGLQKARELQKGWS